MIDDESGKARRNLIVIASFVVLLWWLDLPLTTLMERILGGRSSDVNPAKAWGAVVVALLYFGHRYSYSQEATRATQDRDKRFANERLRLTTETVHRHISRAALEGRVTPLSMDLPRSLRQSASILDFNETRGDRLSIPQNISLKPDTHWTGLANVGDLQLVEGGSGKRRSTTLNGIPYEFPPLARARIKALAWLKIMMMSESSTTYFVPTLLAVAAMWISAFRLGTSIAATYGFSSS